MIINENVQYTNNQEADEFVLKGSNKNKFHGIVNDNNYGTNGSIKGQRALYSNYSNNDKNADVNLKMPKIHANNMGITGENYIELGGDINLNNNPAQFRYDYNDNNQYGINLNVDGGIKTEDINVGMNLGPENNDNKIFKNTGNIGISMKKKGNLPSVNPKSKEFHASKIDEAGHFDVDNVNIDNLKTANVGVSGQKVGDRIIQ